MLHIWLEIGRKLRIMQNQHERDSECAKKGKISLIIDNMVTFVSILQAKEVD